MSSNVGLIAAIYEKLIRQLLCLAALAFITRAMAAGPVCDSTFDESHDPLPMPILVVKTRDKAVKNSDLARVKSQIDGINASLLYPDLVPNYVAIKVRKLSSRAIYLIKPKLVQAPLQRIFEGTVNPVTKRLEGFSKHPKFTRAILAHEYGHAVFEIYFEEEFPEFLEDSGHDDQRPLTATVVPDFQTPLSFFELLGPYSELFADLIAVLDRKNLSAMSEALTYTGASCQDLEESHKRNFAVKQRINETYSGPHTVLAPTRAYLGRLVRYWWASHRDPRELVDRVLGVISDTVEARIGPAGRLKELTASEMNDGLIATLAREFDFR